MKSPLVSIIMATYNRDHYILDSLQSIQNQSYQFWECIIIDDGSSDNTSSVVSSFIQNDTRFSYQKRSDLYTKGLPGCRNYGLDIAKGEFIIFFDDDDIIHPLNLKLCVEELSNKPWSFCRYHKAIFTNDFNEFFDLQTNYSSFQIIGREHIFDFISYKLPISSCSVMWRAECFQKNRFQEDLMYAEEWELYSRILAQGYSGVSIEKTLYYARKHQNSNTNSFYNNDSIRVQSKARAIILIVETLKKNKLLDSQILKYFIHYSFQYKRYKVFSQILEIAKLPIFQKMYLQCYYTFLPIRIQIFKLKKQIN